MKQNYLSQRECGVHNIDELYVWLEEVSEDIILIVIIIIINY